MNTFKLRTEFSQVYRITPAIYEKDGKDSYYAVCPECDNPIQIIGSYKETREIKIGVTPIIFRCNT